MTKLEFKSSISEGAKYAIEKLGGIHLAEKYLEKNKSFNNILLVNNLINDEIINFYYLKSNPPTHFIQFNFIADFYISNSTSKVKHEVEKIFEIYNSDFKISFDTFYQNLKNPEYISNAFSYGPSKIHRIKEILIPIITFYDYLNENPIKIEIKIDSEVELIVKNFIEYESPMNKLIFNSAINICHNFNNLLVRIQEEKFIENITYFINHNDAINFKNSVKNLLLLIENNSTTNTSHINLNLSVFENIRTIHVQLETLYNEYINTFPDNQELKKAKLESNVGIALKHMKKIESIS